MLVKSGLLSFTWTFLNRKHPRKQRLPWVKVRIRLGVCRVTSADSTF